MMVIAEHDVTVYQGGALDQLRQISAGAANCVVTSPPYYGLRNYGVAGQIGHEPTPDAYVDGLREIFAELARVLRPDGTVWLNLGDSYAGKANAGETFDRHRGQGHRSNQGIVPPRINNTGAAPYKSLLGIPWRVALALQADGWAIRNATIWNKPNAMPESVTDRLACRYEFVFLLTRSSRYWFDLDPIREERSQATIDRYAYAFHANGNGASSTNHLADGGMMTRANPAGRNPGDVWNISTAPFPGAHFACMPPELARRCILAGCPTDGVVLDPFAGSGTTLKVARSLGRKSVGIELNPNYIDIIRDRIGPTPFDFDEVTA